MSATEKPQTLHSLIARIAAETPDRPALVHADRELTYGELWKRATRLAHELKERGVAEGDVVAILLPRSIDLVIACVGALAAGVAALPLEVKTPAFRNQKAILAANAKIAIVSGALPPGIASEALDISTLGTDGACHEATVSPDSDAFIVFTSGTTGEPKGVAITHRAVVARTKAQSRLYPVGPDERYLLRSSAAFIAFEVTITILASGVPLAIVGDEDGDEAVGTARVIEKSRVTNCAFVPRFIEALLEVPDAERLLASLTRLGNAGEALPMELARRVRKTLPWCRVIDRYGTTEVSGVVGSADLFDDESLSWPVSRLTLLEGVDVRLVSAEGSASQEGEIWVASAMLSRGYLGRESDSERKFVDVPGTAGAAPRRWYRTGDRGRFDDQGRLTVLGRLDLELKIDGVRIDPLEIENALRRHPSVADAAVWAHRDGASRMRLVAYVVETGDAASASGLRRFLGGLLPRAGVPATFVHLERLPRTASGKVDRAALPAPATATLSRVEPRTELEAKILELFREAIGVPDAGITDDFFEWGGDSLRGVELMSRISNLTSITLPAAVLLEAPTVAELAPRFVRGNSREIVALWLRKDGDQPPLICVPGLLGDPLWFHPLIESLPPRQPLIGLAFGGLRPGATVDSIADKSIEALEALDVQGPCSLLGYSVGGVFAVEIARRLRAAGRGVRFVGLIDTVVPAISGGLLPAFWRRVRAFPARFLAWRRRGRVRDLLKSRPLKRALPPHGSTVMHAARAHSLAPFDFDITLFRVRDSPVRDALNGWGAIAKGKLDVVPIDGRHGTVIHGGRSEALAFTISREILKALETRLAT